MSRLLKSNCKQNMLSFRFLLSVLVCVIAVFATQIDVLISGFRGGEMGERGFFIRFLVNGLRGQTILFMVPILSTLPGAAAVEEDIQSGFLKSFLHRTNRKAYMAGRILSCSLAGGSVFLACAFLAAPVALFVIAPGESGEGNMALIMWMPLFSQILLLALSGSFWGGIGMLMALMTGSVYAAYIAPFVFYYVGIILYERYFPDLFMLYPKAWLLSGAQWPGGIGGTAAWMTLLILLVWMTCWLVGMREIKSL